MINLECLKTVDRTIAVGNRRVMVTFDKSNVPIIYSGILPGDYLCWSPKRGWYCSASVDNPKNIMGIFIDEEGNYFSVISYNQEPCLRRYIKLRNMPSLNDLKKIENVREILDNSLIAAGFEKLPADFSKAFWSCDDRFFNRQKRPLLIQSYKKLQEKYQIKSNPFVNINGEIIRTYIEERKPVVDLYKSYKILLVDTGEQDGDKQIYSVLYEFEPSIFYILTNKLKASAHLQQEDYKRLLSMQELRRRLYFPKIKTENLKFLYEDGTLSEQLEQKKVLGIPFMFQDGTPAIVYPYPFVCNDFEEFRQFYSKLISLKNKVWSFPKYEHLIELAHSSAFKQMQCKVNACENWQQEWAFAYVLQQGDIRHTWMVPVEKPAYVDVADAYKKDAVPIGVRTTLNDNIRVLFVMYYEV